MSVIKKIIEKEDGQAMILVVIVFTVLLGFSALVIDYGYLSLQKRELQNAADAAALAGVVDLSLGKNDEYEATVIKYVKNNNTSMKDIPGTEIKNYVTTNWNKSNNELTVTINYEYDLFFGNIFDFSKSNVAASATAIWEEKDTSENNGGAIVNPGLPIAPEEYKNKVLPIAILESDLNQWLSTPNLSYKSFNNLGLIARPNFAGLGDRYHGFLGYYNAVGKDRYYNKNVIEYWFEGKKAKADELPTDAVTHNRCFKACTNEVLPLANNRGSTKDYLKEAAEKIEDRTEDGKSFYAIIPVVTKIDENVDVKIKYFIKVYFIDVLKNNSDFEGENNKKFNDVFKGVEFLNTSDKNKYAFVVSFYPNEKYNNVFECEEYVSPPDNDNGNGDTESKIVYRLIK